MSTTPTAPTAAAAATAGHSIAELRTQLQALEARRAGGTVAQAEYQRERNRLERALADQVLAAPGAAAPSGAGTAAAAAHDAPRAPRRLLGLLAGAILVLGVGGYLATGSPELIAGVPKEDPRSAAAGPHGGGIDVAQFAAAVEQLAAKLKEQPDNAEGWAMLARSYVQLGRTTDALPAFAKALALTGDEPRLLADYADALAVTNNRNLEGEPTALVERALKVDPAHPKSLALAGTAAYNRKDYAGAVRHWERLAEVAPPDSPFRDQLLASIAEARQLGGMPAAAAPAVPGAAPQAAAPNAAAAADGPVLRGTVRLAPALAAQASPEDTVFVFARPAEGSRMPLAIVRKQVKDLPFEFTLDDRLAMTPAARLSLHPKVVVDARVSKSGQAQASAGDLAGRSAPVANNASGLVVEINEVVKP
jgi:cytochrome c-type biogenesis protein CcmH